MTVEQFNPKQTTTMGPPKKVIEKQSKEFNSHSSNLQDESKNAARIGFISLGWAQKLITKTTTPTTAL